MTEIPLIQFILSKEKWSEILGSIYKMEVFELKFRMVRSVRIGVIRGLNPELGVLDRIYWMRNGFSEGVEPPTANPVRSANSD